MEDAYAIDEEETFSNVVDTRKLDQLYNHTPADGTVELGKKSRIPIVDYRAIWDPASSESSEE